MIFNNLKSTNKHKITLTLHAGTGITEDRDDNFLDDYMALETENTLLDNDGDVMSWHADSTEDLEDCNTTDTSNSVDHSTSKGSTEDESIHNTETELRDHPFQEKDTSPIMTNNTNLIIDTEREKGEDSTEVFPINGTIQIPSMLKTHMMLDEKYLGTGTSSKNMSLKIKKKTKAVTKRNKISKTTKKVIKQKTKSAKKTEVSKTSKGSNKACSKKNTANKTAVSKNSKGTKKACSKKDINTTLKEKIPEKCVTHDVFALREVKKG